MRATVFLALIVAAAAPSFRSSVLGATPEPGASGDARPGARSAAYQAVEPVATPTVNAAAPPVDTATPTSTLPPLSPAVSPSPSPPAPLVGDPCWGDEQITYVPGEPRANNELVIVVTSSRPHPYGRVAGTEKTTFVRERPGQLGYVWEWSVALTWPGRHEYTFYVDSTVPCKSIEIAVRHQLATRTPTPYSVTVGNGNDNGNVVAPAINAAAYVGTADTYNCASFVSQRQAQVVLRWGASVNLGDPNRLDTEDGVIDGVACSTYDYGDYRNDDDTRPVSPINY
jgi:hypothetical protein